MHLPVQPGVEMHTEVFHRLGLWKWNIIQIGLKVRGALTFLLSIILHCLVHLEILSSAFWRVSVVASWLDAVVITALSSAKFAISTGSISGMAAVYKRYNNGTLS